MAVKNDVFPFDGADMLKETDVDIFAFRNAHFRQCMELLDLEKPTPDACAQPRLGQVAEQEFGLEDATQVPVGGVEVILGGARDEARKISKNGCT
jgi:hypothetical protein